MAEQSGESSLDRFPLSDSLLDGAGPVLRSLAAEVRESQDRPADAGDLLVLLASVPGGLAARALTALGVEARPLTAAVELARAGDKQTTIYSLAAEIDRVRREKEAAVEAQEFVRAAELRDRERAHNAQKADSGPDQALADALTRLGLA